MDKTCVYQMCVCFTSRRLDDRLACLYKGLVVFVALFFVRVVSFLAFLTDPTSSRNNVEARKQGRLAEGLIACYFAMIEKREHNSQHIPGAVDWAFLFGLFCRDPVVLLLIVCHHPRLIHRLSALKNVYFHHVQAALRRRRCLLSFLCFFSSRIMAARMDG